MSKRRWNKGESRSDGGRREGTEGEREEKEEKEKKRGGREM